MLNIDSTIVMLNSFIYQEILRIRKTNYRIDTVSRSKDIVRTTN